MRVVGFLLLVAIAFGLWTLPSARAAELPQRIGMYPTTGGGASLAMLDSKIEIVVRGPIIEAVVSQTFRNTTDKVTEATYIFPLPADAAVSAMSITTGTRTIHAAIEKRADAQKRYEQAVASGVRAAMLEQERPDVFTQTVSAIPARGSVTITLRFDTVARYRAGTWELVVPLVVAPRFVPGAASGRPTTGVGRAPDTDRAPDASRVTPGGGPSAGGKTTMTIEFVDVVETVTSPSHALTGSGKSYTLVDPVTDHDAIVRWRAKLSTTGWVEQDTDGGYAAIVVEASAPVPRKPGAVKFTLVLDRAATTRGDADAVMRPLVRALLGKLDGTDRVAVTGSNTIASTTPTDALRTIEQSWTRPAGPFDLTKVLLATKPEGTAVVLISDGLVADDAAAIAAAGKLGAPIHVIGVGPAPNRSLLGALASVSGGTIRFAGIAEDLGGLAREIIADVQSPVAPVTVAWGLLAASDVVPAMLPRLGAGQAMLVLARVTKAQAANGRVRNEVFAITPITSRRVEGALTPRGAIARRWARDRLDELLARRDATATTAHALRYGLVSPYTTMVAIGDEVVVEGGVKRSVAVPVSVPAGMRWQAVQQQVRVVDTTGSKPGDDVAKKTNTRDRAPDPVAPKPDPVATTKPEPRAPVVTKRRPERRHAEDADESSAGNDDDDDDDEKPRQPSPAPQGGSVATMSDDGDGAGESEEMQISESTSSRRQRLRLALALGGGLAYAEQRATSVVALAGRLELGGRTLFGLDASLLVLDGSDVEGRLLVSFARRGLVRFLELGGGLGLHIGDGVGPAASLSLRARPRARGLGGYLRYDGAYVIRQDTRAGEHAATVGLEFTW